MATSIIDQFIVTLGLDSSKYHAGQKQAVDDLNKLKKEAGKTSKELSSKGKEAGQYFSELRGEAVKLFAVLSGGVGFASFIDNLTDSNNQLGLLSKSIGVSARDLVMWSNASEKMGGSAAAMKASFASLKKAQLDYQLNGQITGNPTYLSYLRINPLDDPLTKLKKAADFANTHSKEVSANVISGALGVDEGTVNLLIQGSKAVKDLTDAQKKLADRTVQNIEKSEKFFGELKDIRLQTTAYAQDIYDYVVPTIEKFAKKVVDAYDDITDHGKLLTDNKEIIKDFFIVIAAIIGGVFVKAMWSALAPMAAMGGGIGVLALAIAGLYQDYQTWKKEGSAHSLIDYSKWEPGINNAITGLTFLRNILRDAYYYVDKLSGSFLTRLVEDFEMGFNGIMEKMSFYNKQAGAESHNESRMNRLMDIIGEGESGGNYGAYNQGTQGGKIVGSGWDRRIPDMTIGEIKKQQMMHRLGGPGVGYHAVGRYQYIMDTLSEDQKKAGLKDSDLFSPENQDKLFLAGLPQIAQDYANKKEGVTENQALEAIGNKWAIVGVPSKGGASSYGSGNKSSKTITDKVIAELHALRGDAGFYTDLKAGASDFLKQGPNAINTPSNSTGNTNNTRTSEVNVQNLTINSKTDNPKDHATDFQKAVKNMSTFNADYGMN